MKEMFKSIFKEKNFLITVLLFLGCNAFLYWFVKIFQGNPIYISFPFDDKIPFIGQFIYIYNMFYPFCFFALYILYKNNKKNYYKGLIACSIGVIICDIIFLSIPTIMYRPTLPKTDVITNFVLKFTFFFDDPPLNCFPSIHCLFCFQVIYSFLFTKVPRKTKLMIITISMLIILSTLLVKQHYIFDMLSAFVICIVTNLITEVCNIYNFIQKKVNSK